VNAFFCPHYVESFTSALLTREACGAVGTEKERSNAKGRILFGQSLPLFSDLLSFLLSPFFLLLHLFEYVISVL
jgi:hypothetical protein